MLDGFVQRTWHVRVEFVAAVGLTETLLAHLDRLAEDEAHRLGHVEADAFRVSHRLDRRLPSWNPSELIFSL